MNKQATFTRFDECTKEDIDAVIESYNAFAKGLPARVLDHLRLLDGDFGGFNVDRLQHCLQTATRAHHDGKDEEYVVCALLHDIGDIYGRSVKCKPSLSVAVVFCLFNFCCNLHINNSTV